jgi:hypothetical protein
MAQVQFRVQQMVPLSDVQQLLRQLQQLHEDAPRYRKKETDDLVGEVQRLVGYVDSTTVWFSNFTTFIGGVSPALPADAEPGMANDQSFSVDNLIKRAANPTVSD